MESIIISLPDCKLMENGFKNWDRIKWEGLGGELREDDFVLLNHGLIISVHGLKKRLKIKD